jgi:copper chaperone CopZ
MERLTFTIPALWADHHVLAVRDVLGAMPGVSGVEASAMKRQVSLEFDPTATSADAIAQGLSAAGYAPGDLPEAGQVPRRKPAWAASGYRVAVTNQADLTMSGDFRKY